MAYALIPDPLIVTHRVAQPGFGGGTTELNDYSGFKRRILDGLTNNFAQGGLKSFYLDGLGVVEIETVKRVLLKSSTETLTEQEVVERHGLAKVTPELDGGIVRVLIFNEAPQPWEPGGIGLQTRLIEIKESEQAPRRCEDSFGNKRKQKNVTTRRNRSHGVPSWAPSQAVDSRCGAD